MKKFGFILLVLLLAVSAYLAWSYFAISDTGKTASQISLTGNGAILSGSDVKNLQDEIITSGKSGIETVKSLAAQIPEAANGAIGNIINQAKNAIKEKIDPLLQTTSSPALQTGIQSVPVSTGTASGSPQSQSSEPSVCFAVSEGTSVSYGIEQPFSGTSETSYKIDWGDGETASGIFQSGEQNIFVSHSYAQQGNFSVIFTLTNSSTVLTASRSVCVK
ncbi:MAG TPA: PKD domain-containing protein [Candidatus Paceibacterota bacterium]|nr:PKD domain-containing protein [Candidatus Paceibacterota bacterium]